MLAGWWVDQGLSSDGVIDPPVEPDHGTHARMRPGSLQHN